MKSVFTILIFLLSFQILSSKNIFKVDKDVLSFTLNDKVLNESWRLPYNLHTNIIEVECAKKTNIISLSDGKNIIKLKIKLYQQVDIDIVSNSSDTAKIRFSGVEPNAKFTSDYIKKYKNKTFVEIPEVSELVNIIMVLHNDAEKEENMFDTKSDYYQRVKTYFEPFKNHPAVDTIQKYISGLEFIEEYYAMFSDESYSYYYALKMNACAYHFNAKNKIENEGYIKEHAKGWLSFDPMKDVKIFEDFAIKSDFRKFYRENKPYYDSLITTYKQLNPIQKMQEWLDRKFEFSYDSYVIIFSPLVYGAHSAKGYDVENFSQTFMFICKSGYDNDLSEIMNELIQSRIVFTEIDHNYVNPISDRFIDSINQAFSNRTKWVFDEAANSYSNPYMVFNEYMTWAMYSLYLHDNYPDIEVQNYLPKLENQMEEGRGFINFEKFNQTLLNHYIQNPNIKMPDLYKFILDWSLKENG